jgi:hypothetical protein
MTEKNNKNKRSTNGPLVDKEKLTEAIYTLGKNLAICMLVLAIILTISNFFLGKGNSGEGIAIFTPIVEVIRQNYDTYESLLFQFIEKNFWDKELGLKLLYIIIGYTLVLLEWRFEDYLLKKKAKRDGQVISEKELLIKKDMLIIAYAILLILINIFMWEVTLDIINIINVKEMIEPWNIEAIIKLSKSIIKKEGNIGIIISIIIMSIHMLDLYLMKDIEIEEGGIEKNERKNI